MAVVYTARFREKMEEMFCMAGVIIEELNTTIP